MKSDDSIFTASSCPNKRGINWRCGTDARAFLLSALCVSALPNCKLKKNANAESAEDGLCGMLVSQSGAFPNDTSP